MTEQAEAIIEGAELVGGSCGALKFAGVSRKCWDCCRQIVLKEFGIEITEPRGRYESTSWGITWDWREDQQTAQLECYKSPTLMPCSLVNAKIKKIATGCGAHLRLVP